MASLGGKNSRTFGAVVRRIGYGNAVSGVSQQVTLPIPNRKLKRNALYRAYLVSISVIGAILLVIGVVQFPGYPAKPLFLLLVGLAATAAVLTTSVQVEKSGITYSVGPVVSMAVIPGWGPVAATLVSTGFGLCLWLLKRRDQHTWKKSGIQLAFNNGMHAIGFLLGGSVLGYTSSLLGKENIWGQTLPWLLSALVYDEVNIWLLIVVLRLQHGPTIRPLTMWREDRWASQISVLVLALGGGILAYAIEHYTVEGVIIFYLPVVLSAYAFRLYVGQMQEHMNNLENIVAERTKDLADLNQQKDAYLAVLTHDMMTPLTSIQLCVEELATEPAAAVDNPYLTTVLAQSHKTLLNIVRNILDIEKLRAGGSLSMRKSTCDLAELLQQAVNIVQADADGRGLQLTTAVKEPSLQIYADREQMARVLLNLIANAVKYTPAGGAVAVTIYREGSRAVIEVRDTGYGIPSEELPYIFDRFRRGERLKEKAPGTGLGLAITKALVAEHGGEISVRSEVGKGSLFTVHLPILDPDAEEEVLPGV